MAGPACRLVIRGEAGGGVEGFGRRSRSATGWGNVSPLSSEMGSASAEKSMPANSGMAGFGIGSTAPAFFDVADVAGVEAALAKGNRR